MKIMDFDVLCEYVVKAHDRALLKGQIPGLAPDKSLESVLRRPYNRLQYGMVDDAFHLAACFAVSIIRLHAFNDANKRTGLAVVALNFFRTTALFIKYTKVLQSVDNKGLLSP